MYDPIKHIDEMITHFVSDELRDVIHFVVTIGISYLVGKNTNKTPKSWTLWLIVAMFVLMFLVGSAIQAQRSVGFNNGVWFAVDCFLSLVLSFSIIYPFTRRSFAKSKPMDWSNPALWTHRASPDGLVTHAASSSGLLRLQAEFSGDERWAHLENCFPEGKDFSGWSGIKMQIKSDKLYPESYVELQVVLSDGTTYTPAPPNRAAISDTQAVFLFHEMNKAVWSPENHDAYLDLRDVKCIIVACNTRSQEVGFCIGQFALVRTMG